MTDNELKQIRQKISCPQLGDKHYGEWGILTQSQRSTIKRMLDYIDAQKEYINRLQAKNEELVGNIDKLKKFKAYFDDLYGCDLEVLGWHENGDSIAFDEFYDSATEEMEGEK